MHERSAEERAPLGRPDVGIHSPVNPIDEFPVSSTSTAPLTVFIPAAVDELTIRHLEILDTANRSLVTAIEVLSPSNKRSGSDRDLYWSKVHQLLRSRSHFVELDLLRGGPRMPWNGIPKCDYCAIVSRADRRPEVDCWPIMLRDPLPILNIPLASGDKDATVDLQKLVRQVHAESAYELSIYSGTPTPRLVPEDEAWAKSLLVGAGYAA